MVDLTSKQKRALRAAGRALPALGAVGKAGLTDAVIASIDGLLARHELVKVRLGRRAADGRREMAQRLALATGAVCLAAVGRTVLLYRADQGPPPEPVAAGQTDTSVSR